MQVGTVVQWQNTRFGLHGPQDAGSIPAGPFALRRSRRTGLDSRQVIHRSACRVGRWTSYLQVGMVGGGAGQFDHSNGEGL